MGNQTSSFSRINHSPINPNRSKCLVPGCKQNHIQHYCRFCKNIDSDHFSANCSNKQPSRDQSNSAQCKVPQCKEKHTKHFCKVCKNANSNHLASGCPLGIKLYHGTKYDAALSISKTGFRPSKDGCMGAGVYFTPIFDDAASIAKRWNEDAAVIECRLDDDNQDVQDRMHEVWGGVINNEFKEYVVRESFIPRIKIVKIYRV